MLPRVIPVRVGNIELLAEMMVVAGSEQATRTGDANPRVIDAFQAAEEAIVEVAASTVDVIRLATERGVHPDKLEVQFGLKFSAQGHVILAGTSAEASLTVKLVYDAKKLVYDAKQNAKQSVPDVRAETTGIFPAEPPA